MFGPMDPLRLFDLPDFELCVRQRSGKRPDCLIQDLRPTVMASRRLCFGSMQDGERTDEEPISTCMHPATPRKQCSGVMTERYA